MSKITTPKTAKSHSPKATIGKTVHAAAHAATTHPKTAAKKTVKEHHHCNADKNSCAGVATVPANQAGKSPFYDGPAPSGEQIDPDNIASLEEMMDGAGGDASDGKDLEDAR